ncbi:hypothetical protein U1Q18_004620 [Sarracenia purpurea var. burkii]
MAMQIGGLIHDQNLKSNVSKAQKHGGGLGGRRALNDISNSGRPSVLETSKKNNSTNVISVDEDIGLSKLRSFRGKTKVSKGPEKLQAGGRKALGDLTNSGKPHVHQTSKKNLEKKLSAVVEENILPDDVAEERFLHNHQECIKAREKAMAMDMCYFLKTIGLDNDNSMQLASPPLSPLSRKSTHESSPPRYLEMEEESELLLHGDLSQQGKIDLPTQQSPSGTLKSPKGWKEYNGPNFMLMETPKLPKY